MDKRKPPADDRAGLGRKSSLIESSGEGLQKGERVAICFIYPEREPAWAPRGRGQRERKNGLGVADLALLSMRSLIALDERGQH